MVHSIRVSQTPNANYRWLIAIMRSFELSGTRFVTQAGLRGQLTLRHVKGH